MALTDWLRKKELKPVQGGNIYFENMGVPPASNATSNITSYKSVVYACVSAIAEEVGKMTIELYQPNRHDVQIESHPILSLLKNPNPEMKVSQYNLFELLQTYMELSGECFWYLGYGETTKMPKRIITLRPDKMNVAVDKAGAIKGYTYRKDNGEQVPLENFEVIHFKMPNPLNQYRGMGTVQAGMEYIQTEEYASRWARNALYNDARPSAIVSLNGNISPEMFNSVKKLWHKTYGGTENANKTAVLKNVDATYTKTGTSLDDVALKELKNLTRDDIMFMFRVSKPILGILEDVNLASAKSANYAFMARVIKPKMERIVDTLQQTFGEQYKVQFDFENPVKDDEMEKATYFEKMLNVGMTINEVREELGYDPIANGDSIYQPMNLLPVGEPAKKELTEAVKTTTKITKTNVVKHEHTDKEIIENKFDKNLTHWKNLNRIYETYTTKYRQAFVRVLDVQEKTVLNNIKPKKDIEGYMFDDQIFEDMFVTALSPVAIEIYAERGKYAGEMVGVAFEAPKAVEKTLATNIIKVTNDINRTHKEAIRNSLVEGLRDGESLVELQGRVKNLYTGYKGYEAERLARTESKRISDQASVDAYKQSSVVTGKQWYASPNACGFCAEMDGVIVDLDANFVEMGGVVTYLDDDEVAHEMGINYEPIDTADLHPNCTCEQLPWSDTYESTGDFQASQTDDEVEAE